MSKIVENLRNREPSDVGNEAAALEIERLGKCIADLEAQLSAALNQINSADLMWRGVCDTQRVELAKQAKIVEAARALLTRHDFWDELVVVPGEYDSLVEAIREADKSPPS